MRIDGFQCDSCTKIEPGNTDHFRHGHAIVHPLRWFALGVNVEQDTLHFCSKACLSDWLLKELMPQEVFTGGVIHLPPDTTVMVGEQTQSNCKARRFLLVDEHAEFTEGVKWGDGCVSLDLGASKQNEYWSYDTWDEFKAAHPGSDVQWIDQEAKPS